MSKYEYLNKQIEALSAEIGAPITCWSSPDGLPNSVLQIEPVFLPMTPSIPLRICASLGGGIRLLDSFLKDELGLVEGTDYERHNNGMRHGACYFDFYNPELIQRLETYARDKGLKPKDHTDAATPLPSPSREDRSR